MRRWHSTRRSLRPSRSLGPTADERKEFPMISYRENLLKFYNRKCPDYIPDMRRDFSPLNVSFCQYEAHPPVGESGYDGFGVYWQYEEKSKAHMPMPDPKTGKYVMTIDDMENWRDFIKIPDPDAYD